MKPQDALVGLRNNTEWFLRNYYIIIAGSTANSGEISYQIGAMGEVFNGKACYERRTRPGTILGNLRMHKIKNFKISVQSVGTLDNFNFRAHSVKMFGKTEVALNALPGYTVPANAGPDIMVTGKLSGCSFCCLAVNGGVHMTHIQPTGTVGSALRKDIAETGCFAGYPGYPLGEYGSIYGVGDYSDNEDVTIVGVRSIGGWVVYAQVHTRRIKDILRVDPVYP